MQLPFTATEFVAVFARYNAAIWPTQLVAYALGITALVLAFRPSRAGARVVTAVLAGMWAFTGIGYHLHSFSAINPAARVFGLAFVAQAVLLAVAGFRGKLRFRFNKDARSRIGFHMVTFSMILYPLIGLLLGHGFPNGPVFGLTPCPLAIFTFGMLLLAERPPRYLVAIPMLWALVGFTASLALGIREDTSLLVCGILGTALILLPARRRARARALDPVPQT